MWDIIPLYCCTVPLGARVAYVAHINHGQSNQIIADSYGTECTNLTLFEQISKY